MLKTAEPVLFLFFFFQMVLPVVPLLSSTLVSASFLMQRLEPGVTWPAIMGFLIERQTKLIRQRNSYVQYQFCYFEVFRPAENHSYIYQRCLHSQCQLLHPSKFPYSCTLPILLLNFILTIWVRIHIRIHNLKSAPLKDLWLNSAALPITGTVLGSRFLDLVHLM